MRSTLLLFVDGLGIGADDPERNPVHGGAAPCLSRLLREQAVPIDACLGVPGLPQSATGQTALLTGINAPRLMGRHIEGFPGHRLRAMIRHHNIFRRLAALGLPVTFANAYYVADEAAVMTSRLRSVTTIAALDGCPRLRMRDDLHANRAVYQNLTREGLDLCGYRGPLVTPADAAEHLAAIAELHAFTLFEYFQTDRAGHKGDATAARMVLGQYDAFLERLLACLRDSDTTVLLTSDHGNIEDLSVRTHTRHPVPLLAQGPGAEHFRAHVHDLTDVAPALLSRHGG